MFVKLMYNDNIFLRGAILLKLLEDRIVKVLSLIHISILLILLSKKETLTENTNHFMIFVKEHMARILINEPLRA